MRGTTNINDRNVEEPYKSSVYGPMVPNLLYQTLLLKSGESLTTERNETHEDGVKLTETRTVTIK